MIGSVHLADVGTRGRLAALSAGRPPARFAGRMIAAGLTGSFLVAPDPGRVGLIAFWDDEAALENFLATHPLAQVLSEGWQVRLAPVRASGDWPGLPEDLPRGYDISTDGPAAVLTLGRLRLTRFVRFRQVGAPAEARLAGADGLLWATGLVRPPVVATFSLWKSAEALAAYAYRDAAHAAVIRADKAKPFHHRSAFIRFRPYGATGHLDGRNPLPANWAAPLTS